MEELSYSNSCESSVWLFAYFSFLFKNRKKLIYLFKGFENKKINKIKTKMKIINLLFLICLISFSVQKDYEENYFNGKSIIENEEV